MKTSTPRSPVLAALLLLVSLAFVACKPPPPRSQLDTADTIVSGAEILTKIACDDAGPFGRVHPLTLDVPEPTVEGVYQAVRSYLCADTFTGLLSDARGVIRRALDRARVSSAAESDGGTAAQPSTLPAEDSGGSVTGDGGLPSTPTDTGPPSARETSDVDAGEVSP